VQRGDALTVLLVTIASLDRELHRKTRMVLMFALFASFLQLNLTVFRVTLEISIQSCTICDTAAESFVHMSLPRVRLFEVQLHERN
jgi:hypothetical protein